MVNKLPSEQENPYDALLLQISEAMLPILHDTGPGSCAKSFFSENPDTCHTPNMITTYSFTFTLLSRWFLLKNNFLLFVVFGQLGYFFDCMDGQMARTYNQVTKLGDLYDHSTDVIGEVLLFIIVWHKYRHVMTTMHVLVFLVLLILVNIHIGCQQIVYNDSNPEKAIPETLDYNTKLCPNKKMIKWTRFFGFGTWQLGIVLLVFHLHVLANGC